MVICDRGNEVLGLTLYRASYEDFLVATLSAVEKMGERVQERVSERSLKA